MNFDDIPNDDFNYIVNNEEKALFESLKTFKMFDLVSDLENEVSQFVVYLKIFLSLCVCLYLSVLFKHTF